jgi:hypothetical protein
MKKIYTTIVCTIISGALLLPGILALSSCEYLDPNISKAITEKEQAVLMAQQNQLLERQAIALERIATAAEKR